MNTESENQEQTNGTGEHISERTVSRMRWYLYALEELAATGMTTAASREIAEKVGVKPGLVRKDLCMFGGFGRPSVGYNIAYLRKKIREILAIDEEKRVAWIGSLCMVDHQSTIRRLSAQNCRVVALFDSAEAGNTVGGLKVMKLDDLPNALPKLKIDVAVLAVEKDAQQCADKLIGAGVNAILNMSPIMVTVPRGAAVRHLDLAGELVILARAAHEERE